MYVVQYSINANGALFVFQRLSENAVFIPLEKEVSIGPMEMHGNQ